MAVQFGVGILPERGFRNYRGYFIDSFSAGKTITPVSRLSSLPAIIPHGEESQEAMSSAVPTPSDLAIPDDQLIEDALAGRQEAFGELMRKYQNLLMEAALRMLRNREEAEDVVQQTFMDAFRHLADFRNGSRFSTWLYAIALNRARNQLRSRKVRRTVSLDEGDSENDGLAPSQYPDPSPQPDEIVEKQFNLEWIRKNLTFLSSEYQAIFTLHYLQEIPLMEIAQRLNRPMGTIKVYLHRARKELYSRWEKQKGNSFS
jgi:RNA polymerase sigma-70 factor (ECF subfamily)